MTTSVAHTAAAHGLRGPGIDRVRYGRELAGEPGEGAQWAIEHQGRRLKLFFLLGHPRSGTNWLGKLVNLHPKLHSEGEFRLEALRVGFNDLVRYKHHVAFHEPNRTVAEECFRDSVRRIMAASYARSGGSLWIGDRTPRALEFYLPGAPALLIFRDPRDVLTSWAHLEIGQAHPHYKHFEKQLGPIHKAFSKNRNHFHEHPEQLFANEEWMRHLAQYYKRHTEHDLAMLDKLQSGEVDGSAHVIRYELLQMDPEGERAKVYEYFGLDPAEAAALSDEGLTKPGFTKENPGEMYRKGRSGDWKPYFTPKAKQWFLDVTGDLLVRQGYEQDDNW